MHVPLAPGEALLLANASFWDAKREELRLDMAAAEVQVISMAAAEVHVV